MYESFFGFVNRPFMSMPTLDRYYPARTMEQTFQSAARAISRAEGPVAIFGGTGLGKTICCLRIAEHFRRAFEVVLLSSSAVVTRRALLQSLLFELRMPYRDMNEGELRLTLMNRLQPSAENPSEGVLLIIDEAQTLSAKLLNEVRLLTNVMRNGMPRVRLVLCGNMKLEELLAHPSMESLNQRLASRCYLTPLSMEETASYVIHKIELSGIRHEDVITRDALEAIYRGSDGIPRLIDQLADQTMLLAAQERTRPVSAALVGKAWGMLQQLPNPWSEPESIVVPKRMVSAIVGQQIVEPTRTEATDMSTEKSKMSCFESETVSPKTSAPQQLSKSSIIEFGSLEDNAFSSPQAAPQTPPLSRGSVPEDSTEYRLAPVVVENQSSSAPMKSWTGFTELFGGDFDEEFNLPVQSSNGYKAYSGVAFGNLNHDLSSFSTAVTPPSVSIPEADDFFDPHAHQRMSENRLADAFAIDSMGSEDSGLVSNITPSQASNLERQVEEEMRELVSGLNMNAMTFDPMQSIVSASSKTRSDAPADRFADRDRDVVSFAQMSDEWNHGERYSHPRDDSRSLGDDRDMLVVEENIDSIRGSLQSVPASTHRPVMHPYAKLFSNLRS